MLDKMYPFNAGVGALIMAQLLKPFFYYMFHRQWRPSLFFASGGMPSSHAALVSSVTLAVGLVDKFSSTLFAVTLTLCVIVCFDAANVRYYAGQNIALTHKLVSDIQELTTLKLNDPIYSKKMKDVLGHTYSEVAIGILLGLAVAYVMYLLCVK